MGLGQEGEERARAFLLAQGLNIIATNFHSRFGEIDIVAKSHETLHFIEVKTTKHEDALARITPAKMQKIQKTIAYFLYKHSFTCNYQIDAIIVTKNDLEWLENISY
ncbi:MAG: YraN family protein [Campylobacterales bacterium]|nr:YraN family protein [Campylobacterales bacterium]